MTVSTTALTLPPRFSGVDTNDIPLSIRKAANAIKETRRGLFLFGDVGTGKTHTMYALLKLFTEMELKAQMYNSAELLDLLRDDFTHNDQYHRDRLLKYRGVLMIDDVGAEKLTDWVAEIFYKIVNTRYEQNIPLIISSNFDLGGLGDRVGDRVASRIAEMCDTFVFKGEDRRIKRK